MRAYNIALLVQQVYSKANEANVSAIHKDSVPTEIPGASDVISGGGLTGALVLEEVNLEEEHHVDEDAHADDPPGARKKPH